MKKDKSGWIVLFFILLYFSSAGNYINSNNTYLSENAFGFAVIDLCICTFSMMIIPFIFKIVNKEKLPLNKGKRICLWNSIFMFIISCVLMATFNIGIVGGLGAIMFYYINKWTFVTLEKIEDDNYECDNCGALVKKNDNKCPKCSLPFDGKINSKKIKESKISIIYSCDKCGATVNEDDIFCPKCGDRFDEEDEILELDTDEIEINEKLYEAGVECYQKKDYENAKANFKDYIKQVINKEKRSDIWVSCNNPIEFSIYCNKQSSSTNISDKNYNINKAYLYLGMIEFETKKYDETLKLLNKGLKYNPADINILFEKAETYKNMQNYKKFYENTLGLYDYIYTKKDLAHFYRNLGYYYIEIENWDLAKAVYLYSLRFDNNLVVSQELEYIISKSNDSLPAKSRLENILSKNDIPLFVSEDVVGIIIKLSKNIKKSNSQDTNIGNFIESVLLDLHI